MKKALPILFLSLISLLSMVNYYELLSTISISFVFAHIKLNLFAVRLYFFIFLMMAPILLSIVTGIIFYILQKKMLKKTTIVFAFVQLLFFAYNLFNIIEIATDHSKIGIYK